MKIEDRRAKVENRGVANRTLELLRAYRERPSTEAEKGLREFIAERDPYLFSHHPADSAFREHVWRFGGMYFCKGCVMTAAGMLCGGLFFAVTRWLNFLSDLQAGGVFLLLLMPTLITHLLDLPRPCKHFSRFLLGVLLVSAVCMLFVTDSWLVRFVIVGTYFAVRIPLERKRDRVNRRMENGGSR